MYLFVRLTPGALSQARARFGFTHHVGRPMPCELPRSWHYLAKAWNTSARTPVAAAIESIIDGDETSVTFHLFGDGKKKNEKKKKKNKMKVQLQLPDDFDVQVNKVAALVDHFNKHYDTPALYNEAVSYQPSKQLLGPMKPSEVAPAGNASTLEQELRSKGVTDEEMIRFVVDLSALVDHKRSPFVLVNQWRNVMKTCSSPWCRPPLWWCVASTLVGDNLVGMTRQYESAVQMAATCLENWDMLVLLKLLLCFIFSRQVKDAAEKIAKYTRTDIAHERFDCDWARDWGCMAELLDALECSSAAAQLRTFCESKPHRVDGGDSCRAYNAVLYPLVETTFTPELIC